MRGISKSRSLETSKSKLKFNFEQLLITIIDSIRYKNQSSVILQPNKFHSKSSQEIKKLYFCNDRIRHASRRMTSEPGRVFYFYHDGKHLHETAPQHC